MRFDDGHNDAVDKISVNVSGNGECKKHLLSWPGRLGMKSPVTLADGDVDRLVNQFNADELRPIMVLGTGECNAPAYLLGRKLEHRGFKVRVQSTTRSPIHPGNDIASVCRFEDNYQDSIANFIYNLNPDDYREIILCHETPLCDALLKRLHEWHAISARIELNPQSSHAKLHFFRPG